MDLLHAVKEERVSCTNFLNFLQSAIPPGLTEHDSENAMELGQKLQTANRELKDSKEKYMTDIERYHSGLESFKKSYSEENRMLRNKLNVAEAKLHNDK